ncbi:hypothetical protein IFM89_038988 [Coptis chinensis]|uniref:Transposase-associated domain-containing protein n=1 Tax=Coptis chinensis TaxID=261450 RepID=A0A835IHB8_9MAGN|nr:hypothetical protein IFM89_038988 [Coptis chinensis]
MCKVWLAIKPTKSAASMMWPYTLLKAAVLNYRCLCNLREPRCLCIREPLPLATVYGHIIDLQLQRKPRNEDAKFRSIKKEARTIKKKLTPNFRVAALQIHMVLYEISRWLNRQPHLAHTAKGPMTYRIFHIDKNSDWTIGNGGVGDQKWKFKIEWKLGRKKCPCPCKKCRNRYWLMYKEVGYHLISKGIEKSYHVWTLHGEDLSNAVVHPPLVANIGEKTSDDDGFEMGDTEEETIGDVGIGMRNFVNSAFGLHGDAVAGPETTLSALVELHNVKKEFGWSRTGMTGVPSSKIDGFDLSSGDFPTLGIEKNTESHDQQGDRLVCLLMDPPVVTVVVHMNHMVTIILILKAFTGAFSQLTRFKDAPVSHTPYLERGKRSGVLGEDGFQVDLHK